MNIHDVKAENDSSIVNTTMLQSIKNKYLADTQFYDVNRSDFFDKYRNMPASSSTLKADPVESIISKYTP